MSSILKALKKLEEEKSLFQEEKEINVAREILKQNSGNKNIIRWLWLLGCSAALVIIILTAALLRKPPEVKPRELPLASQPTIPALPMQNRIVSPELPGNNKRTNLAPPSSLNEPNQRSSQQPPEQSRDNPLIKGKVTPPTTSIPMAEPPKTDQDVKAVTSRPPSSSEQTLTLSGIAWNKDSADRLAIINGQPTATGANINGVIVEEILPDRVKLSHNGRSFELLIGKNARTE